MALLDNPHAAMYPYHLMNSRLAAAAGLGSAGSDLHPSQQVNPMNGYVNGRFDMRIGAASSSSNRSSTSPNRQNLDAINEDDSSPTHQVPTLQNFLRPYVTPFRNKLERLSLASLS
jgi:hypothetical protein